MHFSCLQLKPLLHYAIGRPIVLAETPNVNAFYAHNAMRSDRGPRLILAVADPLQDAEGLAIRIGPASCDRAWGRRWRRLVIFCRLKPVFAEKIR